jgi:amidohydrolase family protein
VHRGSAALLALLSVVCSPRLGHTAQSGSFPVVRRPSDPPIYEFRNGYWFDGRRFRAATVWTAYGHLTNRRPEPVDSVIDLGGRYVVPPFAEAHNHNAVPSDTGIAHRYLAAGIFYVKNPNNFPRERDSAIGRFNVPTSIDVMFSNAALTGPGGHPEDLVRRNIARGIWTPSDGDGSFYFSVGSPADVELKWPAIVASKPDFIKTYLLFSEEYAQRLADSTTIGWRGLDPAVLALVVRRAHAAGLRVSTHVETAADFRNAVRAGSDEINHLPGFRPEGNGLTGYQRLERYRLTAGDARDAAQHHVVVVTTVSQILEILDGMRGQPGPDSAAAVAVRAMIIENLRVLRDAGVRIVLGSDRYRSSSLAEAFALRATGLFSDTTVLRMWSTATAQAIFPNRKLGVLEPGYEASFLVLDGNPLADFENVKRIHLRVKQGFVLEQ